MEYKVVENNKCSCGGDIDCLYPVEPFIWTGRCFVCGEMYHVIKQDSYQIKEKVQ